MTFQTPADELARRFAFHPANTDEKQRAHADVRALIGDLADTFQGTLPAGREKSLVFTKLEEAMFWANAAIAREVPK